MRDVDRILVFCVTEVTDDRSHTLVPLTGAHSGSDYRWRHDAGVSNRRRCDCGRCDWGPRLSRAVDSDIQIRDKYLSNTSTYKGTLSFPFFLTIFSSFRCFSFSTLLHILYIPYGILQVLPIPICNCGCDDECYSWKSRVPRQILSVRGTAIRARVLPVALLYTTR